MSPSKGLAFQAEGTPSAKAQERKHVRFVEEQKGGYSSRKVADADTGGLKLDNAGPGKPW